MGLIVAVSESLECRRLLATTFYPTLFSDRAAPTSYEQYMVEMINRARAAPVSQAVLQENFPSTMASNVRWDANVEIPLFVQPVQPLAINAKLQKSAARHTAHLLDDDTTGITYANWEDDIGDGTSRSRMEDAGYPNITPVFPFWGEGISWTNSGVDSTKSQDRELAAERLFDEQFTNLYTPGRAYLDDMLRSQYQEIGVSIGDDTFNTPTSGEQEVYLATVDYASQQQSFVTGVVIDDTEVKDGFYQPGEGQNNVQITVYDVDNTELVYGTRTWSAGGFSIPLPNGDYVIRADAKWGTMFYEFSIENGKNTKVDFVKGAADDSESIDVEDYPAADDSKWFITIDDGNNGGGGGGPVAPPQLPPTDPNASYVTIIDRTLVIQGTAANDKVNITRIEDTVYVRGPRYLTTFHKSLFDYIAVKTGDGNDRIEIGRDLRHNYVEAGAGDDTVITANGNDSIYGGPGRDILVGGTGNDRIVGGKHTDRIFGQDGNDTLYGQDGNDFIDCGNGRDHAFGGNHNDSIFGSGGNDCIYGDDGIDTLVGGNHRDLTRWKQGDSRISVEVLLRDEDLFA